MGVHRQEVDRLLQSPLSVSFGLSELVFTLRRELAGPNAALLQSTATNADPGLPITMHTRLRVVPHALVGWLASYPTDGALRVFGRCGISADDVGTSVQARAEREQRRMEGSAGGANATLPDDDAESPGHGARSLALPAVLPERVGADSEASRTLRVGEVQLRMRDLPVLKVGVRTHRHIMTRLTGACSVCGVPVLGHVCVCVVVVQWIVHRAGRKPFKPPPQAQQLSPTAASRASEVQWTVWDGIDAPPFTPQQIRGARAVGRRALLTAISKLTEAGILERVPPVVRADDG